MPDPPAEPHTDYEIEADVFPAELLALDRWFVWKLDNDRKIPRAPWANPSHTDKYVSWKDESVWTDFETADEWVEKGHGYGHASCIPAYEDNTTERLLFFDFDDARDPETGAIHPWAWGLIEGNDLHAAVSTSGTGVHGYAWGSLPEGYKVSFEEALPEWEHSDDTPHLEVYAGARFIALTGDHIAGTPVSVPDLGDTAHELFERFGTERTTGTAREPDVDREELADVETTTEIEDIYDAIALTRPRDIRLRSPVTEEYSGRDANCARDPSWANSESGTRLAEFDDHWLYRKGNYHLDALQVVALEDRIIRDESSYPEGEDFVEAVDALRDRGAAIPELETSDSPTFDVVAEHEDQGDDADSSASDGDDGEAVDDAERDLDAEMARTSFGDPDAYENPVSRQAAETAETDGGAAAEDQGSDETDDGPAAPTTFRRFKDDVVSAIAAVDDEDDMTQRTARHRIAEAFADHYDFVYPEEEVRGWRSVLYVYDPEAGIYEPRGEAFVERLLERAAGDYVTNQVSNEVVGKLERMCTERGRHFETQPERLAVGNGILDLHTGELSPFTPAEYHRTKLEVDWNPDAGNPEAIDDFLREIVAPGDVPTLYRLIAHSLYKEYVGEKAAILIGSGSNGKSMFLSLVEEFIGSFNVCHRELQDFQDDMYAANNLQGKLANLATEIGEQELKDSTTFKKLTGRDNISAPVKFEKPLEFQNYATLMFATNEMPVFGQDNHAIWRRWVYVDFPHTFDAEDPQAKDPEPERVLKRRLFTDAEFEALLVRCQQEIQRWHEGEPFFADALDPEKVRDKMKKAAEPVYAFATTCLEPGDDEDTYVEKSVVRACYKAFADEEDLPRIAENEFGKRLLGLRDLKLESTQRRVEGRRVRVYEGAELSSRGRQVLGVDEPDGDQTTVEDGTPPAKPTVMDQAREMADASDGKPIPKEALAWACAGDIGTTGAEHAIEELLHQGDLYEPEAGHVIPT